MYNKVLVIGSGAIVIGQAAEFDYSGTQACKVLRQEGIEVVLINNNPATIMTDKTIADSVYCEPLTVEFIERIIIKEKPDALLAGMGGQTALNLSMELYNTGVLDKYNVKVIGTNVESIEKSEDREIFKRVMQGIDQPCTDSIIANSLEEAKSYIDEIGYPVVVRPAFTLGGTGGGFCYNDSELKEFVSRGINASMVSQVLVEKSIKGWKEIEYEMMRDHSGNTIVVCNMENFDPVGVHTGDSIVVAPSQTLSDQEYQMLRTASINIVEELGIVGGCNVQLALNPESLEYYVIEVNPRVSRSSALASKATGYPIAKVATKIALGYDLDEIINDVTQKTKACFEPALDYCALKIPKWPFNKFKSADRSLGTQMKATGEVMSIANNFESALLKGIRSLEISQEGLVYQKASNMVLDELFSRITNADDERIFFIAELLRREVAINLIHKMTGIDKFFLNKVSNIVNIEKKLTDYKLEFIENDFMRKLKVLGFSDKHISDLILDGSVNAVREFRKKIDILPSYKMVDTCAGEFDAKSPYYYSTYDLYSENEISDNKKVIIIGSGPISIGQGVEFDYCSVHGVLGLQELGYEAILINNNPETVSTDFDISDKLYFEPITVEDVMNIIDIEDPVGVVLQFGGQTAIKLAEELDAYGVNILGTDYKGIHLAEERKEFNQLLDSINVDRPKGTTINSIEEAIAVSEDLGFPLLVRPSYVIGGEGMLIVYDKETLINHLSTLKDTEAVLIDQYIHGTELEVDCITDGKEVLIPGIMEHLEKAGVHSGDSISIYPTQNISEKILDEIVESTRSICTALNANGLVNIQYILSNDTLYVIEVNPRASRTVPFLSKITNIPMIEVATKVMMGTELSELEYGIGRVASQDFVALKLPVFSMEKINGADIALNPEMKSTGEILSIDENFNKALKKGMISLGYKDEKKAVLITVADFKKEESLEVANLLQELGYVIYATSGTKSFLDENNINTLSVNKIGEPENVLDLIIDQNIDLIINIPVKGHDSQTDGFKIRRTAVERNISCYTSLDTIKAKLDVMISNISSNDLSIVDICDIK